MSKQENFSVYHICVIGNYNLGQGYIGCTSDPVIRFRKHKQYTNNGSTRQKLYDYLREVGLENVEFRIIHTSDEQSAFELEKALRPEPDIGWNTAIGGSSGQVREVDIDGVTYESIEAAKKALGRDYQTIVKMSEGKPTFQLPRDMEGHKGIKPVVLRDPETSEEHCFKCLQEAWEWIGKSGTVNGNIAKQKRKGRTAYGYYWNY